MRLDRQGGVARLTLCRAAKHNAFDDALIAELTRSLRALGSDDTVRSVVLAAEGKSFSAGADLQWMRRMAGYDRTANLADARALAGLMRTLDGLPKPTIAAVQGAAFGGGVGLVACCDIAVASDAAGFCLSEVRLGLIPSVISPYVIAAIGARAARRYFQTAERFDAATALRLALVLQSARREAEAAFGDGRVLLEKYVEPARHIEVQVLSDAHGRVVHLFERDCSLQRRHQKIVEEAPAPGMTAAWRQALTDAAIAAARTVDYVGAGTVEFIVDTDGGFYFMEMNTRLQVEHPVTEMVTGLDLVEWQLRVAAGERLPPDFGAMAIDGHAIEVRLYAEDPERDFLPAAGRIAHLRLPPTDGPLRTDTGVRTGDLVALDYDPMLAKVIAHGADRQAAIARLRGALAESVVAGVTTNLAFLAGVVAHRAFAAADLDTGFVARHMAELVHRPAVDGVVVALAATAVLAARRTAAAAAVSADPHSPWRAASGWRLNAPGGQIVALRDGDRDIRITAQATGDGGWRLQLPDRSVQAALVGEAAGEATVAIDTVRHRAFLEVDDDSVTVTVGPACHRLTLIRPLARAAALEETSGMLTAPMPGKVINVMVAAGDTISRGQPLMVLEAMKMEHTIAAPADGRVQSIAFADGAQVEEGAVLLRLAGGDD